MRSFMRFKSLACFSFLGCCLSIASATSSAQEVVHALAGKVVAVNAKASTFLLAPDDGTDGSFRLPSASRTPVDFDKTVKSETTPASSFTKTGSEIVLFYDGYGNERTALAVQDLGNAPLDKSAGTVAKFNRHEHLLTIKTDAGATASFHIDDKTVAETSDGVEVGDKFSPEKGRQIRVVAAKSSGVETALFVRSS
jgi:hypothetical protein